MRFSSRFTLLLAAAMPLGVAMLVAGTILLVGWDTGLALLVPGFLLLAGGVAAAHTILAPRYGELGLYGFVVTEVSFLLIALFGVGFVTLAIANPLLGYALWRMTPPLRISAVLLFAVWPAAVLVSALTPLVFVEAIGTLFAIPYATLAVEALRLRRTSEHAGVDSR